jgi:hypothetical protein
MSADELHTYFDCQLRGVHECPNLGCNCIAILGDTDMRVLVVKYLCWFNAKTKYEQDSIVFEWFKYSSHLKKSKCKSNYFKLPFIDDGTADEELALMCFALGDCYLFLTGERGDGDQSRRRRL